jgi:hypothetical protein
MLRQCCQQLAAPDQHCNQLGELLLFVDGILQVPLGCFSLWLFILQLRGLGLTVGVINPSTATLYDWYVLQHPGQSQQVAISPQVVLIVGHPLDKSNKSLIKSTDSRFNLGEFPPSPIWVEGSNNKNGSEAVYPGSSDDGEDKEGENNDWRRD